MRAWFSCVVTIAGICICYSTVAGQKLKVVQSSDTKSDVLAFLFGIAISGAAFWWFRSRLPGQVVETELPSPRTTIVGRVQAPRKPKRQKVLASPVVADVSDPVELKSQFEDLIKTSKEQYRVLPIFTITEIPVPGHFEPLPHSDDEELILAVERSNVEIENDHQVREAALAVLADFRTTNSVDAVAEMASYDLISTIRSRALATLADYDHETVFEAILLGCADPSREVRAAAARSLMRLTFNRTEAWVRISESLDNTRIIQAARAARAGDLLKHTFTRLIHPERDSAAEAFAIVGVLIRAGETEEILAEMQRDGDPRISKALLHVLRIYGDQDLLTELAALIETFEVPPGIRSEIIATVNSRQVQAEFA